MHRGTTDQCIDRFCVNFNLKWDNFQQKWSYGKLKTGEWTLFNKRLEQTPLLNNHNRDAVLNLILKQQCKPQSYKNVNILNPNSPMYLNLTN